MRRRLRSSRTSWSIPATSRSGRCTPTFTHDSGEAGELSDSQTLVDAILRSSGAEITEAVGLYVNEPVLWRDDRDRPAGGGD